MTEFNFELKRTSYYNNRSSLLKEIHAPKLSDAKNNLGDTLAKVVFDQCEDGLREDFGLKTPLNGPGNVLWVSPSDLLIGKIALKPPFTPKCLQALTHSGILEIGEGLENKFKEDMEIDKQKALDAYKAELLANIESKMKSEIKDVEIRERLACHIEMERKQEEFDITLKEELAKLEKRVLEQNEDILADQNLQLSVKWEKKMQKEVKKTMEIMTKEYVEKLTEQEDRLSRAFSLEIKKEQVLRDYDAAQNKRKMTEALRQLKHNLECTNLVNMMYILATERQKCCDQKRMIEDVYKEEILKLESRLMEKERKISKVIEEKRKQLKEVNIREICLLELMKQFQKFINFAFKSAPTQAEFLLSIEKMMVFELTKEIATTPVPKVKESVIMPWLHEGKSDQSVSSTEVSSLKIKDNHNCLNELNPPIKSNAELGDDDVLPAIYFKKKTYIREDFRDMLDVGVPMTPSNTLWSKDVEILMDKWQDMTKDYVKTDETISKGEEFGDTHAEYTSDKIDSVSEYTNPERRRSNKSIVQFLNAENKNYGVEAVETQSRRLSGQSKTMSRKSSIKPISFFLVPDPAVPTVPDVERIPEKGVPGRTESTHLLAVKDSLEILMEKKIKSAVATPSVSDDPSIVPNTPIVLKEDIDPTVPTLNLKSETSPRELVVETKDSLVMRISQMVRTKSSREFLASPNDSLELKRQSLHSTDKNELKQRGSKLPGTKNSVEMLRESLHKLSIPSNLCQKRDKQESGEHMKGTQSASFAETCCDKCKRLKDVEQTDIVMTKSSEQARNGLMTSDGDERSVKISCIQVINLNSYSDASPSMVSFNTEPIYLQEKKVSRSSSDLKTQSARAGTTRGTCKPKKIKGKPSQVKQKSLYHCKVVGDRNAMQGDESSSEFTTNRIHSLIKLMSDQPDLMRLFTAGSR